MSALAILQPDPRAAARLSGALSDVHCIVEPTSWNALERFLANGAVRACLVDADHPDAETAEARIARIRRRHPDVTIVVCVESARSDGLFGLGGLGVHGVVDSSMSPSRLRAEVDQAFSTARGDRIAHDVAVRFGALGAAAVEWAVVNATRETSVEKMASALGATPRGLRDTLQESGLPTPKRVLLWGRLLIAGARLGNDGRTVEEVAFSLGYSTASALARAMKRHTGYTLSQVADGGGMGLVRDALLDGRRPTRLARAKQLALLALVVGLAGCAALGAGVDRGAVRAVLESPGIAQMHVGVLAVDAASGRTLFASNETRKFIPASNQKILVTAAALTMLGPDYRFRTEVWATGPKRGSHLAGDLVVVASGDPSISDRFWPSGTAALEALADSLRALGIEHVTGSAFVDVSAWDSTTVGPTREVEDLRFAYGSTGGAFAIDEGEIRLVVEGGASVGSPARVSWSPHGTDDYVRSRVTTASEGTRTRVTPRYLPESRQLVLEGVAEWGTVDTVSFALRDPVRQASAALARAVEEAGIDVKYGWDVKWNERVWMGRGCRAGMLDRCSGARLLFAIESPPLSELIGGILAPSQNWMTEQLLLALADLYGEEGSWSDGVGVVEAFLTEHVGVDTLDVSARDGSGLSAYNLVTPRALVRVLRHMRDGPYAAEYRAALAQPGEERSTLERRLPELQGRLFAKTGTISNVNSLSGYLVRENGDEVIFSILTNGSGLPSSYVRAAIDDIVRALAR